MTGQEGKRRAIFTEQEFLELGNLFSQFTGNKLSKDKKILFESRLLKCLVENKLSPKEYIKSVQSVDNIREEFINVLTTHKTDWFREFAHFDFLTSIVKGNPKWNPNRPLLIWSAASSTGEEAYSLCMLLTNLGCENYKVLGTDISNDCLRRAEEGMYSKDQVNSQVPEDFRNRFFLKSTTPEKDKFYRISPTLQAHTKWRQFNLLESSLPVDIHFDFIFLRNVLIYFDNDGITKIISRLMRHLSPEGYIIIGLSENITDPERFGLKRAGNSIYKNEK